MNQKSFIVVSRGRSADGANRIPIGTDRFARASSTETSNGALPKAPDVEPVARKTSHFILFCLDKRGERM